MIPLNTALRDAVRYWERKRFIYNGVLALIVLLLLALHWPHSAEWFDPPAFSAFFQAAIFANVLFCTAYLVEFAIQFVELGDKWQSRCRTGVFVAGLLLASVYALEFVFIISFFGPMSN